MQKIPCESLHIDRKDRVNKPSQQLDFRPAKERVRDFLEVLLPFSSERARYEASRCIHCPDPAACVSACPVENDIPSAMWLIEQGEFLEAAQLYRQTSNLPSICGRVCPHEQLCEGACVLSKDGEPVRTGKLEAFVADIENVSANGKYYTSTPIPTGKKVAVVGAGPSGLSCAEELALLGHDVTVYDNNPVPGGLLLYGIPNFKLPVDVVLAVLERIKSAGVKFSPNQYIGKDKTIDSMLAEGFHAVYLGVGTWVDSTMDIPGEELPGVYKGSEFLMHTKVDRTMLPPDQTWKPTIGNSIVVIGGGDTASDCIRSALRMGVEEVYCVYRRTEKEMPGSVKDRKLAREEGAKYMFLTQPVRFIAGEGNKLEAIECIKMELGEPDKSGRRRPIPIEGSNFTIKADSAVMALGYWPDPIIGETTPELETSKWGLIITDVDTGVTSRSGIFAGGDAVTGPDLVVTAMATGRKVAVAMNEYLNDLDE
jgi:glutamate synthase (NADPH) small chain